MDILLIISLCVLIVSIIFSYYFLNKIHKHASNQFSCVNCGRVRVDHFKIEACGHKICKTCSLSRLANTLNWGEENKTKFKVATCPMCKANFREGGKNLFGDTPIVFHSHGGD